MSTPGATRPVQAPSRAHPARAGQRTSPGAGRYDSALRPAEGDVWTRDGWRTDVLLVRERDGAVQIRTTSPTGAYSTEMVSAEYFDETRSRWTLQEAHHG